MLLLGDQALIKPAGPRDRIAVSAKSQAKQRLTPPSHQFTTIHLLVAMIRGYARYKRLLLRCYSIWRPHQAHVSCGRPNRTLASRCRMGKDVDIGG